MKKYFYYRSHTVNVNAKDASFDIQTAVIGRTGAPVETRIA